MTNILKALALASALFVSAGAFAEAPVGAPTGSTGLCKDGSYVTAAEKKGACKGHKGIKDWYAAEASPTPAATPAATAIPAATKATSTTTATKTVGAAPMKAPAAGSGPGQVWVNTKSKVYHCQGTKYYGTTKEGEYMTEAAAKTAGNHADHGKACAA